MLRQLHKVAPQSMQCNLMQMQNGCLAATYQGLPSRAFVPAFRGTGSPQGVSCWRSRSLRLSPQCLTAQCAHVSVVFYSIPVLREPLTARSLMPLLTCKLRRVSPASSSPATTSCWRAGGNHDAVPIAVLSLCLTCCQQSCSAVMLPWGGSCSCKAFTKGGSLALLWPAALPAAARAAG